jgi:hypothetical protein
MPFHIDTVDAPREFYVTAEESRMVNGLLRLCRLRGNAVHYYVQSLYNGQRDDRTEEPYL